VAVRDSVPLDPVGLTDHRKGSKMGASDGRGGKQNMQGTWNAGVEKSFREMKCLSKQTSTFFTLASPRTSAPQVA
jgi:hypothetical protein